MKDFNLFMIRTFPAIITGVDYMSVSLIPFSHIHTQSCMKDFNLFMIRTFSTTITSVDAMSFSLVPFTHTHTYNSVWKI